MRSRVGLLVQTQIFAAVMGAVTLGVSLHRGDPLWVQVVWGLSAAVYAASAINEIEWRMARQGRWR